MRPDAEVIESLRELYQRAIDMVELPTTLEDAMEKVEPIVGAATFVDIVALDYREIGHFDVRMPSPHRPQRHWVYRERKDPDGTAVALSWQNRLLLQRFGFVRIEAFMLKEHDQN
jgi:hypothetical protein